MRRLIKENQNEGRKAEKSCVTSTKLDEAVAFYTQYIAPAYVTVPVHETPEIRVDQVGFQRMNIQEVLEVSKVLRQKKEQQKKQQTEDPEQEQEKNETQAGKEANTSTAAYERLDCSERDHYLLYSYNCFGKHSLLGKNMKPGSYGGRMTCGDFGAKA